MRSRFRSCTRTPSPLIRLFRDSGFEILDCIELQPPPGATTTFKYATFGWSRRYPSEEIWRVRKTR